MKFRIGITVGFLMLGWGGARGRHFDFAKLRESIVLKFAVFIKISDLFEGGAGLVQLFKKVVET